MNDTTTVYPNNIDSRRYFSDLSIKNVGLMEKYQELISAHNYDGAKQLLNQGTYGGVNYRKADDFNADTMNMFENRVFAIETYLKSDAEEVKKPDLVICSNTVPSSDKKVGYCWIC